MEIETGSAPSERRLGPDPIDERAFGCLELLDGERPARSWRTGEGFLVMTNLRLVHVRYRPILFSESDWTVGLSLFFYDLEPPRVVAGRTLELRERADTSDGPLRIVLNDPASVAREIEEWRPAGRREWEGRRLRAEAARDRWRELGHGSWSAAEKPPKLPVPRERCSNCGNLLPATSVRCPACGTLRH